MPFKFENTPLEGVVIVRPKVFNDDRGYFLETYKMSDFLNAGIPPLYVQANHSYSTKNVLRGIHFQKYPKPQGKLVRCTNGVIFDVAVDLREDSPTFKNHVGVELSADNKTMLYIPEGFGHGFSVLSEEAEIQYMCTNEYDFDLDAGIRYDDPDLNINWKIENPLISEKDSKLPTLEEYLNQK